MAFPQTTAPATTSVSPAGTTHNINMPATVNAGDLLLCFVCFYRSASLGTTGTPSGWTKLWDDITASATMRACGFAKIADGSEDGTTVDFTTSNSSVASAHVYAVTDWYGDLAGVEYAATSTAASANPNAPSKTASWGALDNLWFAVAGYANGAGSVTAYPGSYTDGAFTNSGAGAGADAAQMSCRRELASATEDPGAATLSTSERWIANTVVIRPVSTGQPGVRRVSGVPHMRPGARGVW